jgi:subtilisin family serine protease
VVLSWAGVGYALQAAWALEADPARTAWRTLGYASPVTVPLDGAHRFFRLVCPPPTPDFGLGLGTAALLVRPGSNATVTVSVMSSNTFQRAVILACAGDAPGIACEFLPNPLTPPADGTANSTLTLSAASNAPPGTYVLQLTGTSGNLIRAVPLQVTVPLLRLPGAPEEPARDRIPDLPLPEPLSEDIVAPQGIPISVRDVIVVLRETATVGEVNALLSLLSADIVGTAPQCRLLLLGLVGPSDLQRVQVAELAARTQNSVAGASINYALEPDLLPPHNVDPDNNRWTWEVPLNGASGDWGLKHIRQPQAWNLVDHAVRRGATIDALVVEANENLLGANVASATHVDLAPRVDVFPGALPSEHATMVAGIIGAVWDNNRGVEGVYPRRLTIVSRGRFFWGTLADTVTRVLGAWADVRVVNYSAGLSRSYFVAGIDPVTALVNPAVPAGAANPTWRGQLDNDGNTFLAAMNAFVAGPLGRTNWLMGCSAGNIRRRPTTALDYEARDNSPVANVAVRGVAGADAGADHFLTVEAMDAAGNRAAFSASAGTLSAPGVCVRSTELDNPHNYDSTSCPARDAADPNYATSSGTSFAAPHVAGLAAYVWSLDSGLSYQAVRQAVEGPFNRVTVGAGPAGGAAGSERIDGFAAILHIDSARGNKTIQRALVNVDDGSHYDGNARIDHDDEDDDENWEEPYEAVVPTGIRHPDGRRGDSDGLINMKDFRPFRDAFVQTALLGLGGVLDGGPIHFKKDLNFDGCVNLLLYRDPAQPAHPPGTIPVPASCVNAPDENVYPRYDFNGSGQIDALGGQTAPPGHAVAPFKIDPDTACTGLNTPAGCLRDLDVMADPDLWDSSSFGEWVSVTGPDGVPPAECEIPGIWAPMRNLLLDRNGDGLVDYLYSADLHFILGPLADSDYDRITVEVYSGPWSKCNVFPLSVKSRTIVTVPLYPGASVLVILTIRDDDPDPRLPSIPYPYFPALSYGQDMTIRWPAP